MTNDEADSWQAVGDAVRTRRVGLGWTQTDAARRAGVSELTWRTVERGDRVSMRTAVAVARALGWPDDAFDRIRRGEPPSVRRDRRRLRRVLELRHPVEVEMQLYLVELGLWLEARADADEPLPADVLLTLRDNLRSILERLAELDEAT